LKAVREAVRVVAMVWVAVRIVVGVVAVVMVMIMVGVRVVVIVRDGGQGQSYQLWTCGCN